jgi:transposase
MIRELQKRSRADGAAEVVLAYEASGQGFGLYDELTEAGITCHVLAPTRIARSPRQKRDKTDDRDAEQLLQLVRGHVLAGNDLPTVWVPDPQTRDDREVVRARLDAGAKLTRIKTQIGCLLKRNQVRRPGGLGDGWTEPYREWLETLSSGDREPGAALGAGGRVALGTLLRQMESLEGEIVELDQAVQTLSEVPRYAQVVKRLDALMGVGVLTAMVFLTEMGDLSRFRNRRQVACYLGTVPSKAESGKTDDRKGHITRQGPARVRRVLCQASWARVGHDPQTAACYDRIVQKNPKHKKIALVAVMRRLAVLMWHRGLEAQRKTRVAPAVRKRAASGRSTGPLRSVAAATSDERARRPILDRRRSERSGPGLCRNR